MFVLGATPLGVYVLASCQVIALIDPYILHYWIFQRNRYWKYGRTGLSQKAIHPWFVLFLNRESGICKKFWYLSKNLKNLESLWAVFILFVTVAQSLNCVWFFGNPWTAARQALLFSTISQSLLRFMSLESVMLSNHLILCHPFLLLPSI